MISPTRHAMTAVLGPWNCSCTRIKQQKCGGLRIEIHGWWSICQANCGGLSILVHVASFLGDGASPCSVATVERSGEQLKGPVVYNLRIFLFPLNYQKVGNMRYTSILASTSVLALSIVSTTFVLLTLTSKRWAVQNYYPSGIYGQEGDGSLNVKRATWAYRSPFYRCGVPEVYENETGIVPFCQFYRPYGTNTSCRTSGEMHLATKQLLESHGVLGTSQECQQGEHHYVSCLHCNTHSHLSSLCRKSTDSGVSLHHYCFAFEHDDMSFVPDITPRPIH